MTYLKNISTRQYKCTRNYVSEFEYIQDFSVFVVQIYCHSQIYFEFKVNGAKLEAEKYDVSYETLLYLRFDLKLHHWFSMNHYQIYIIVKLIQSLSSPWCYSNIVFNRLLVNMLITDLIAIPICPNHHKQKFYYCKHPLTKLNSRGDVITLFDLRSEDDDDYDDINLSSLLLKTLISKFGKKAS